MELQLEDVSGIGKATAKRLREVGIDTVEKLATTKIEDLLKLKIKGIGASTGEKYIQTAQELIEKISPKSQIGLETKPIEEQNKSTASEEIKSSVSDIIEPEKKKKKKPTSKKLSELKKQIKQQAECNIGLVGHVDHGMRMSNRHFP